MAAATKLPILTEFEWIQKFTQLPYSRWERCSNRSCYGGECAFAHPRNAPVCRFYLTTNTCKHGDCCHNDHEHGDAGCLVNLPLGYCPARAVSYLLNDDISFPCFKDDCKMNHGTFDYKPQKLKKSYAYAAQNYPQLVKSATIYPKFETKLPIAPPPPNVQIKVQPRSIEDDLKESRAHELQLLEVQLRVQKMQLEAQKLELVKFMMKSSET